MANQLIKVSTENLTLLPCPFCHSTHLSTTVTSGWRAFVACGVCLAAGPVVSSDVSEEEARGLAGVLWNGRGGVDER